MSFVRRPNKGIELTMNIGFRPTSDDDFEPRSMRGGVGQSPQNPWTGAIVTALINCVDDKDKSALGGARKFADEFMEEGVVHGPWRQVWVVAKMSCDDAPKRGEGSSEFVDESRQDIPGLVQTRIVPLAEKCTGKVFSFVESGTNRVS